MIDFIILIIFSPGIILSIATLFILASEGEKEANEEKTFECSKKECRFFDEETGCLLGWNKAGACSYIEEGIYD